MKYKIFISGVQNELKEERFAVKDLIAENILLQEYFNVFLFEDSPAKSKSAKTAARDLDDLVEKGVLERMGEKRGIYYVLAGKK